MSPFEFVSSICTKDHHFDVFNKYYDSAYKPFLVNRHLSFFPDTLFLAQHMNLNWHIPHQMQYEFYYNSVKAKKRYKKWPPAKMTPEDVQLVQDYYKVNIRRARDYLSLLTTEQLVEIKNKLDRGGDERENKKKKDAKK